MTIHKIPVVKMGGGFLKAILNHGTETVFGRDAKEIAERLKVRLHTLRSKPIGKWSGQ
jgi:hypothetical protein